MQRKYYLATPGGKSFEAINQWQKMSQEAMAAAEALCKEFGADMKIMHRGSHIDAFWFEKNPGAAWRRLRGCRDAYTPHKVTREGKEIAKRIDAVKIPDSRVFAELIGGPYIIFDGYHASTTSFEKHGEKYIVSVPVGSAPDGGFVPPDATLLQMSEYWAIREAADKKVARPLWSRERMGRK
jgi:hypothetical protein